MVGRPKVPITCWRDWLSAIPPGSAIEAIEPVRVATKKAQPPEGLGCIAALPDRASKPHLKVGQLRLFENHRERRDPQLSDQLALDSGSEFDRHGQAAARRFPGHLRARGMAHKREQRQDEQTARVMRSRGFDRTVGNRGVNACSFATKADPC